MSISLSTPRVDDLPAAVDALKRWQYDGGPLQLHPGDLGWHSMNGAEATAAAIRMWACDGEVLALGLLDGAQLLRMAIAPYRRDDEELAVRLAIDLTDPERGVLPPGGAIVEARGAELLSRLLLERGWERDELWTPFRRDLSEPVQACGLRIEVIGPDRAERWVTVHWSAFRGSAFVDADRHRVVQRWLTMVGGPLYGDARSLMAFDEQDEAVAVASVWSAGAGRPGLIEPMGVHRGHHRRGYGTAITRAAAAALRDMGSSSAIVCAESSNIGAVATYASAGFTPSADVADLRRTGEPTRSPG
ncbi:GNAT family N-acetyltransferase [Micromonospora sp. WMMD1082]|uniref:GNAT family N-acetyltransferase n=1 Tax=Micromonospora sp. WMMD1082 TaxID=3016104 RepID=UPI002417E3A2|nr:GNAT family N-acetyltransferase [Micromonospora sp. WMMD1082]MDG4798005.1 GNAT family N-acetyltransferase [Micromonospora sp. WMMD1082]